MKNLFYKVFQACILIHHVRFEKKVFYYLVQEAWNKVAVVAYAYEASEHYLY